MWLQVSINKTQGTRKDPVEHPLVVSISPSVLSVFSDPYDDRAEFMVLALYRPVDQKARKYIIGQRESLVHARADQGAGVGLPAADDMPAHVIKVAPFMAAIYGLAEGDQVHVRRIRAASVELKSVMLVPLDDSVPSDIDLPRLKKALLAHSHVVAQGGVILLPESSLMPAKSPSKESTPNGNHANGKQTNSSELSPSVTNSQSPSRSTRSSTFSYAGYFVLSTHNVMQGILTAETTVTISGDPMDLDVGVAKAIKTIFIKLKAPKQPNSSTDSALLTSSIMSPTRRPLVVSSFMLGPVKSPSKSPLDTPSKNVLMANVKLRLSLLNKPIGRLLPEQEHRDLTLEVGATLATLKSLQIFSGSWVLVTSVSSPLRHIARIFVLDPPEEKSPISLLSPTIRQQDTSSTSYKDNVIYVSPLFLFNMGLSPHVKNTITLQDMTSLINASQANQPQGKYLRDKLLSVSIASEASISRVNEPNSSGYSTYRTALKDYFAQPRLCKVGDVFTVVSKCKKYFTGPAAEYYEEPEGLIPNAVESEDITELAHFKITSASTAPINDGSPAPEFFWIDKNNTTLFSEGAVTSRLPPHAASFLMDHRIWPYPPGYENVFSELTTLVSPCLHPMASSMGLSFSAVISAKPGAGKKTLIKSIANHFGIHIVEKNAYELIGNSDAQTESKVKLAFKDAANFVPCVFLLDNVDAFEKTASGAEGGEPAVANTLHDCIKSAVKVSKKTKEPFITLSTCENITNLAKTIRACFRHEISLEMPDEKQRREIIGDLASRINLSKDVSLSDLALRTASFSPRDLKSVIDMSVANAMRRVLARPEPRGGKGSQRREIAELEDDIPQQIDLIAAGIAVTSDDVEAAINIMQKSHAASLGTPKIPNVRWEDVGGLVEAKKEILDTIQLPLQHPELFASGMQRSGILLFGPPGTGKTLLAKAIATECNLNFISVKGPELLNMYVGESEKNVRDVFQKARDARPCVIFFDELDSLAPNRGRSGDSGGVMDRIVSQLLAELSGINSKNDVFVIGATNRPDLIDPALLIPGRFDRLIYLGVNTDNKARENIIAALTRKFKLGSTVNLLDLADTCPGNLTGADLYALCSDALLIAIRDQVSIYEKMEPAKLEQLKKQDVAVDVVVEQKHFLEALKRLTPSVSFEELKRYKEMAEKYTLKKQK